MFDQHALRSPLVNRRHESRQQGAGERAAARATSVA